MRATLNCMSITTALAIWGAFLSSVLGAVKLLEFWRDRPTLRVEANLSITMDVPHPLLSITVSNRGRQPVTIVQAGFLVDADVTLTGKSGVETPGQLKLRIDGGEIQPVTPGGVARYEQLFDRLPQTVHADFPLRAYVIDSNTCTTYGGASRLFRRAIHHGWRPPADTDPQLLAKAPEPIKPRPVYRRWQVWKPKGTRPPLWGKRKQKRAS